MKKVGIFMADGCEEIEGLTVVDIVRRAKLEMTTISITDEKLAIRKKPLHILGICPRSAVAFLCIIM